MLIRNYISDLYPTVHPFDGVNSIEEKLLKKNYLVVIDEDGEFQGILVPCDLIKRPHKIVIDCLTEKEHISADETIISVLDKFEKNQCSVLPVFQEKKFIGIILKYYLLNSLKNEINELQNKLIISQNAKSSFLSNLSHEIRTPLNGLLGFLEIISKLDIEDFKTNGEKHYNIVTKCADRFLLIMNDLIDLALINSGDNIKIEKENVKIENIFFDLKEYFETKEPVLNKELSIHYTNPDTSLVIFSDGKKIRRILYHLIDNAIKFSNNNKVIFGYKLEFQNIVFFVTNQGSQIHEDKKMKIFEVFEKQDFYNGKLVSGLGIGLPLIKKLSELLEGKVDFETNGTQTTFFFTIPNENEKTVSIGGSRRLT